MENQTQKINHRQMDNLSGQQFGMLTAVESTPDRFHGSIVWRCRCECGNEVMRSSSQLKAGLRLNCGCLEQKAGEHPKEQAMRAAGTSLEFLKTGRTRQDSLTGVRGVNRCRDKYRARIHFQGKNYSLGIYRTIEEAAAVRKEAENCLYGEFLGFYEKWKEKADADPGWGEKNPVSVSVKKDAAGRFHVSMLPDLDGKGDIQTQKGQQPAAPTVSDYCDRWLAQQEGKLLPSSCRQYRSIINRRIRPALGTYLPSQLSKDKLDLLLEEETNVLSAHSVQATLYILRALLEYIRKEEDGALPDDGTMRPRFAKEKLSLKDRTAILDALTTDMDTCKLGVFLALMTGMSVGEICALRWKDISFLWGQITVTNTLHCVERKNLDGGKKLLKMEPAKRVPQEQVIPMTRMTIAYCKKFLPQDKNLYVMTGTLDPMPPWTVTYRFRKHMKECGLPRVHFDDLYSSFPRADADMDFEEKELDEILNANLKKVKSAPC